MSDDLGMAFAAHGLQLRWAELDVAGSTSISAKHNRVWLLFDAPCEQYNRDKRPGTWFDIMNSGETVEDVVGRYRRWEKGAALAD